MSKADSEIKIVVFLLGKEEYALNINKVQEIIRVPAITKLPNTPEYVLGIFNLREAIIPVIDLKEKFIQANTQYTADARVLIMETTGTTKLGIIVDEILEIITISPELLVSMDSIGMGLPSDYLLGVARVQERLIFLLNNEKIVLQ